MEKESLINLGLTDGEAKVYLALLKLGSVTVGPIVKGANVAYSNIYEILERLLEKGLISFIIKEKTKYFQAVPPSRLSEFLEKKEDDLEEQKANLKDIIPQLEKLQNPTSRQEAEIFTGLRGIKTAYERLIKEAEENKSKWLFFYVGSGNDKADEFYAREYQKSRNIEKDMMGIAKKEYKSSKFIKSTKFKMKYVDFPVPGNIDIVNDNLLFITWSETPFAVLIQSEEMSNNFKNYFYSIWKSKK
ncbi:MAG: hypothetical protein KJ879_02770 [Nanoarchaeota archaeon]|nr:hypothetical protein [Nanoarchaeota archaeon]